MKSPALLLILSAAAAVTLNARAQSASPKEIVPLKEIETQRAVKTASPSSPAQSASQRTARPASKVEQQEMDAKERLLLRQRVAAFGEKKEPEGEAPRRKLSAAEKREHAALAQRLRELEAKSREGRARLNHGVPPRTVVAVAIAPRFELAAEPAAQEPAAPSGEPLPR
ncbi:MAG: hypothetical protein HY300_16275 [Verrucomicrobia bacterium]|nr:hypothetical protein [Verrucomicrobiota bacterium]